MRRFSSHELGSYVLEVAGVVMGVAIFVLGAADVTRIFQARSAVRAAVNEGARCLYPTDADCVAKAPGALSAPGRAYDVWVWGSGYEVAQESYVASAQWRQEPVYETTVLSDEIVDVTVERSKFQYRPHTVLFPTTAHIPYLMQTRNLPKVVGGEPLAPEFADPYTLTKLAPSGVHSLGHIEAQTSRVVGGSIRNSTDERLKIGSVSFSVRGAWPSMPQDLAEISKIPTTMQTSLACYAGPIRSGGISPSLDWTGPAPHLCRYRETSSVGLPVMQNRAIGVPVMLRITGTSFGTSVEGDGKIVIRMSWSSPTAGSGSYDLGGRALRYGGSGTFVPRGLDWIDIDHKLRTSYKHYDEIDLYSTLPLIPLDATVTIDFFLMSFNNRRVGWTGGALQVWHPQYRFIHEQHECGYSPDPTGCASPPNAQATKYVTLQRGARFMAKPSGPDTCSLQQLVSAEQDVQTVLAALESHAAQGKSLSPSSFYLSIATDKAVCPSDIATHACGYRGAEYFQGCKPNVSLQQAGVWCGVTSNAEGATQVINHTMKTTTIGSHRARACSDAHLPQCTQSYAREVDTVKYVGPQVCDSARAVSAPQFVVGPLYQNDCESRQSDIQNMYRTVQKIPADVPISVIRLPAPPMFSAEQPLGSCTRYHSAQGSSRELLCGKGLSSAAAERCCAKSDHRCRKQAVIEAGAPAKETARNAILSAAQQRVVEGVQAGYPPARYQSFCSSTDPDCLQVSTSLNHGDSTAVVSAKVTVPLRFLQLFGGELTVAEHSSTRVLERTALW